MTKRYFKPHGIVVGEDAKRAIDRGEGRRLAGGRLAFTHLQEMQRGRSFDPRPFTEFQDDEEAMGALDLLSCERAPVCDIDMSRSGVMGILNVTPDSFSDGGELGDANTALARASTMALQGADIWDVGGESTRPGSDIVETEDELARVGPVIEALSRHGALPISIDSRKPAVFEAAVRAGASMINDVSALAFSPDSLSTASSCSCPVILMHAQGDPKTMQEAPHYDHVLLDVYDYLEARVQACIAEGFDRKNLLIDPGIGFGKTLEHNLVLLRNLSLFHGLGCPIVLGTSRKSFIGAIGGGEGADQRLGGSIATVLNGATQGAQIFRVHDVLETRQALSVWETLTFG